MKYLRYRHLFRLYEHVQPFINYSIPLEEKLADKKVLVIAPHQDDEAIGCAGTVINHVKNGGEAEILFCTNDTYERMKESEKASSIIGSKRNHFLQFPIRTLDGNKKFEENLSLIFQKTKPETVFLPFWFDNHPDHRAVSKALISLKKKIPMNFMVYAYSVWTPLNPNCIFDISGVWEEKKKAIECYKTQLASRDYVKIAQSLNQYWAEIKNPQMQYAETFFKATAQEYISLGKKIF
ncbi:MAG: PIG-L family deacetylase [Endomicrobia bacterium]|nr:PIG-L family deacetylase [Endomicrobiia bacterium]